MTALRLAEPGSVERDDLARRDVLSSEQIGSRRYTVEQVSPGWEIAGSMLRWTDGYYLAGVYDSSGTRSGQQFTERNAANPEQAARELIGKWTKDRRDQIAETEATRSWIADLEDGGYL